VTIARSLAWILLIAGFFVSGLLRQWHHRGPALGLLSLLLILLLVFLYRARWPDRRSTLRGRVPVPMLLSFLLLVVGEKWFALVFMDPQLLWIPRLIENDYMADATYRLMTGLGLLAVCLGGLLFLFRPLWPQLRSLLAPGALARAALVLGGSLVLLYVGLFGFLFAIREQLPFKVVYYDVDRIVVVMLLAQAVRAVSEELYFRGILQEGLVPFLATMGVRSSRLAKMVAVALVSLLFVLEHAHLEGDLGVVVRQLAFVLFLSVLFGLTLVISRSLYLAMGFHFVVDLFVMRGGLVFMDMRNGVEIFQPRDFILLHAVLLFVVLFAVTGHRRRARSRAAAPAGEAGG
jgi:membrane protease YdiL (CAAX protease family)